MFSTKGIFRPYRAGRLYEPRVRISNRDPISIKGE
jgi:hypothetical protein